MGRYEFIAVYIVASQRNGTIYIGVTSNLLQRGLEHREARRDSFAREHGCKLLVWWEQHGDTLTAIAREKQLKRFGRNKKLALIEANNPTWRDLYEASFCHAT